MAAVSSSKKPESLAKKEKTKEEKSLDNFLLTITCPICFHYYREPTNFPNCPHTLCRECMKQLKPISAVLNPDEYHCPVCRTVNKIPKNFSFPVNYVIRQIVEMVEVQEKTMGKDNNRPSTTTPLKKGEGDNVILGNEDDDDKCIHYLFPVSDKEKCRHCGKSFCEPCCFVHAEKLKQKLAILRRKWEADQVNAASSSELNNLYSNIASELNGHVQEVKKQVDDVIESIVGKVRSALNEKAQIIIAEADSFRSEQLKTVNRAIEAGRSSDAICEKIDTFLRKSVLETGLNDGASLIEHASERELELKILDLLKNNRHGDKIIFTPENKVFDDTIKVFVENVDLGWVHVDGDQFLLLHESAVADDPANIESQSVDVETKPDLDDSDMTVLSSIKLEDCSIKQPIGMVAIPGSDYFVIADSRSFLTVFRAPGDKLVLVCTLSICDPDVNKANFRQYFSGEMTATGEMLYLVDASQRRIVDFPIPWPILENLKTKTRRSLNTTKVFSRSDLIYRGLTMNLDRNELYTIEGNLLLAFCTKSESLKFSFKFDQNASLLAVNSAFGFIVSRDDGTICVKSYADDGKPIKDGDEDLYFSENDFDDGLSAERFSSTMTSGHVAVDTSGNVYFAEKDQERLGVCCHVNSDEDFSSWTFKKAACRPVSGEKQQKKAWATNETCVFSVKPSAIVALSENSVANLPNLSVVALIDSTTNSVLLTKLSLTE